MAEIPVERKGGIPWWAWLLGALLLIGLLYLLFRNDDPERVAVAPVPAVVTDTVVPVAPALAVDPAATAAIDATGVAETGPITDLATIVDAADGAALVGRPVALNDMRVLDVVGDRTFFVGTDQNRRAFVVLNEVPTPNGVEGRYNVESGQTLSIQGVMRRPNEPAFANRPIEGLPTGTDVVIHAQSLNIAGRP